MDFPGSPDYRPNQPWVSKFRSDDKKIAADLFIFVAGLRPTGSSQNEAWAAPRKAASTLNHLGIQDHYKPKVPNGPLFLLFGGTFFCYLDPNGPNYLSPMLFDTSSISYLTPHAIWHHPLLFDPTCSYLAPSFFNTSLFSFSFLLFYTVNVLFLRTPN
jgi:hypothetical protein